VIPYHAHSMGVIRRGSPRIKAGLHLSSIIAKARRGTHVVSVDEEHPAML